MKLKRFVGADLAEAVAAVRRELGRDAVVVQTRRVAAPGWKRWLRRHDHVEVVAAVEDALARRPVPPRPSLAEAAASEGEQSRQLAMLRQRLLAGAATGPARPGPRAAAGAEAGLQAAQGAAGARAADAPQKRRVTLERLGDPGRDQPDGDGQTLQIEALRQRLLARPAGADQPAAAPAPRQAGEAAAIDELRRQVLAAPRPLGAPRPIVARPGQLLVVVLVGPTGAGKTTTVAKLAAHLGFEQGWRVGVITADTFRMGAVEQLGAYARLLGVPFEVAPTPKALERSLTRLAGCEVALVDTSGRGHRDGPRMEELGRFLAAARATAAAVEVHLVLPAGIRPAEATATLAAYRRLGAERLLVTKLDECEARHEALEVAAMAELPLSYCTTGQRVPEDLAIAWPDRLAAWAEGGPVDWRGPAARPQSEVKGGIADARERRTAVAG